MVYLITAAEVKKCSMDSEMACNTLLGVNGIRKIWHEKNFLSKYIEVKRSKESNVRYISLYKDSGEKVRCETATEFELLEHNAIMDTFRLLYREEIGVVLK